jgi:hypothetical protein
VAVNRQKLQLIGVTAMLIACKYEEMFPPTVDDFVYISDSTYPREEVIKTEGLILTGLRFNLTVATPYDFLVRFAHLAGFDDRATLLAHVWNCSTAQHPLALACR